MHVTDAQECGPIPLIISGAPRSGTTLLYNLFDGHPDISWLVTECYFFEYLHECGPKNAWIYRELAGAGLDALIEGIRDRDVLPRIGSKYAQVFAGTMKTHVEYPISWDEDAFRASLAGADFSSIASMWASLSRACLAGLGETEKSIVCLKSPDYGKSAFAAVEALSTAKSIVILRDPVAAIDSLKYTRAKRREKLLTWPTLSMVIGNYLRMFETLLTKPSPDLLVVLYEELVASPELEMRRIADWLGIRFDDRLTEPTFRGLPWYGHSSRRLTDGVDATMSRREPIALTPPEVRVIKEALWDQWIEICEQVPQVSWVGAPAGKFGSISAAQAENEPAPSSA